MLKIKYPEIGICGLSCRLCPMYHTTAESRCGGCKTEGRMRVGCPFITCAIRKKGVEFCWDCPESKFCIGWKKHRYAGKRHDSFKCYRKLEDDISFIKRSGIRAFEKLQKKREDLLAGMLKEFNEGRSKSYYCIAVTVMEIKEIERALVEARKSSAGKSIKERSMILHSAIDRIAGQKKYCLKLRNHQGK